MQKVTLIIIVACALTGCSLNYGFPKEINGKLRAVNSQKATCNAQ